MEEVDKIEVQNAMIQSFFESPKNSNHYNFQKVCLFLILYCEGSAQEKSEFFFRLVQKSFDQEEVDSDSFLLNKCLENMIFISTVVMGEKMQAQI